ncbi:unnamed protein product [Bursaphelenchus xylophilus]|uniref:(pine wood nematode) hypothetical protein n=1 Tax=Bursaphelenchus xylophilus TaxID=6326 RepID=A0A7I8XD20_BURXY|nr:unnamed protein product [Bursaphelenchus xylophilus]CAG9114020.1 unnamed protein product [Bursaphelenchus xylophilus]
MRIFVIIFVLVPIAVQAVHASTSSYAPSTTHKPKNIGGNHPDHQNLPIKQFKPVLTARADKPALKNVTTLPDDQRRQHLPFSGIRGFFSSIFG